MPAAITTAVAAFPQIFLCHYPVAFFGEIKIITLF